MHFNPLTQIDDLPLGPEVKVLAANEHGLVALEKPAGLMSHPNKQGEHARCLLKADYDYDNEVYRWNAGDGVQRAWLLNRLDSPTSGVILLALDEEIIPTIRQLFAAHKVQKTYYAVVKQTPAPKVGCWKDALRREAYRKARVVKTEPERFAQTDYQVMDQSKGAFPIALLRLMPVTGRTHQLRIQCQQHNHPIIGDRTYGDFSFNRRVVKASGEKRMLLHAAETVLRYTFNGREHRFEARSELPEAFLRVMRLANRDHSG